jgi:hypothetical protein
MLSKQHMFGINSRREVKTWKMQTFGMLLINPSNMIRKNLAEEITRVESFRLTDQPRFVSTPDLSLILDKLLDLDIAIA